MDSNRPLLAPSEAVFVTLQAQFSERELLAATLKAALLACEHSGDIRLAVTEHQAFLVGQRDRLSATQATERRHWPRGSVESRLRCKESRDIGEMVAEWLAQDTDDPWALAREKIQIGLAIRGVATMGRRRYSSRRTYTISPTAQAQAKTDAQPIVALMRACERERPHVWELLGDAIARGVEQRRMSGEHTSSADPWKVEAADDQIKFGEPVVWAPAWAGFALATGFAAVDGFVAWISDQIVFAGIFAVSVILVLASANLPWPPLQKVLADIGRKANARSGMATAPKPTTFANQISGALVGVSIGVLFLMIMHAVLGWAFWPVAIGGAVAGIAWFLRRISGVLISERVVQPRSVTPPAPPPTQSATLEVRIADLPRAPQSEELGLQVISPDQVPPPSPVAAGLLRLMDERPRRVRRIYAEAVVQLIISYVVIVSAAAGGAALSTGAFPSGKLIAIWIAAAISLALVVWVAGWTRSMGWQHWLALVVMLRSSNISLRDVFDLVKGDREDEAEPAPGKLRPTLLSIVASGWLVLTLVTAPFYAEVALAVTLLLFASAMAYVAVLRWRLNSLERQYPLAPPFRLLALRVFGSPSLKDFMELTAKWRGVGTIQRLDGPDTAGVRSGDVVAMLSGRLDSRIAKSETELDQELAHFVETPDSRLQYRLNSIQCTDATWRAALDRLLGSADIVVMDLSGFSQERLGCKYELGKLIDAQALNRLVLLTDESTDHVLLEAVLKQAWRVACDASRNQPTAHRVMVIQTGGVSERGRGESEYDWKTRSARRLHGDRLVALMIDKALVGQGMRKDIAPTTDHWARVSSHRWLGVFAKASLVLLAVISVAVSWQGYRTPHSDSDSAGISTTRDGR